MMVKPLAIAASAVVAASAALIGALSTPTPGPTRSEPTSPPPTFTRQLESASPEELQRTLSAIPGETAPPPPRRYTPPQSTAPTQSTAAANHQRQNVGQAPSPAFAAPRPVAAAIYITQTGTKYHRQGCRHLAKSAIPIALAHAQNRGYTPCSVCRP